ncbi:MAG: carbohydrate-binding family 9-like protein [Ginsengibacter sp.]
MIPKIFNLGELRCLFIFILLVAFDIHTGSAQSIFAAKEALFSTPRQYTVSFNSLAPILDGKIDDAVWKNLEWTEYFVDIEGDKKPAPPLNTRVKMSWNNTGLFIAAEMQDPHVWANLKNYDDIVYNDNDFEIFIDPDNDTHRYYEIEVNALSTVFDLFMAKPYRNGSGAMIAYDLPGLKSAVNVQGTLNQPNDKDNGWTVEIFVPFAAVTIGMSPKVPSDGDFWRINFSRVEYHTEIKDGKYSKKKNSSGRNRPEENWVWSPQGVINMHFPERWGYLHFSKREAGEPGKTYSIPYSEIQKKYLWLVYYLQKDYFQKHHMYASKLKELGIYDNTFILENKENKLRMEATSRQFMVYISSDENIHTVNDEGLVQLTKPIPITK